MARIRQFVNKRRLFALQAFKDGFSPDNVVGVYMPYMVVDARASAEAAGMGEIETRRYTRGQGKNAQTYYDADVWRVQRQVDFTVDDLPLESSARRGNLDTRSNTNNIINTILPFDTKNAVQWNAAYLMGYTSEKRDRDVQHLMPRLQEQMLSVARAQMQPSVRRYDRGVRWEHEPGGGLRHYIAVNGRTGETMGSVPVQQWKLLLAALGIGTVVEALALWIIAN